MIFQVLGFSSLPFQLYVHNMPLSQQDRVKVKRGGETQVYFLAELAFLKSLWLLASSLLFIKLLLLLLTCLLFWLYH